MEENYSIIEIRELLTEPEMWEYNHHLEFFQSDDFKLFSLTKNLLLKSIILMKLAEFKKATKYLHQYLIENQLSLAANAFLGRLLVKYKKISSANNYFSIALKRTPISSLDILGLAIAQSNYGNIEKSIINLELAINILKMHSTVLHLAAEYGLINVTRHLVSQYKKNINSQDSLGWTALHWASWLNEWDIIILLIDNGANIESKGKHNETPLYLAVFNGHKEATQILLNSNANMDIRTNLTNAPLHMASYNEHVSVMSMMLDYGADIDIQTDIRQNTPLHVAAWHGKIKSGVYLLDKGCDINARTVNGCTPLHRAALNGKTNIILLLLERGASINSCDKLGRTPLDCAYKNRHLESYEVLYKERIFNIN